MNTKKIDHYPILHEILARTPPPASANITRSTRPAPEKHSVPSKESNRRVGEVDVDVDLLVGWLRVTNGTEWDGEEDKDEQRDGRGQREVLERRMQGFRKFGTSPIEAVPADAGYFTESGIAVPVSLKSPKTSSATSRPKYSWSRRVSKHDAVPLRNDDAPGSRSYVAIMNADIKQPFSYQGVKGRGGEERESLGRMESGYLGYEHLVFTFARSCTEIARDGEARTTRFCVKDCVNGLRMTLEPSRTFELFAGRAWRYGGEHTLTSGGRKSSFSQPITPKLKRKEWGRYHSCRRSPQNQDHSSFSQAVGL
ncbi:hypothetical protein C8R45DRAFT_934024 [Mycena sanguinolenta]|nr:hypothetical protein C8R45DRAFT_934024 [Mycena sanguinolenta]